MPILHTMSVGHQPSLHMAPPRQIARPGTAKGAQLLDAGLDVAYQPIVHLGSGSVLAYEALARPRHPDVPSPLDFFAALERSGLRLEGERNAFDAALAGTADRFPKAKLFINASPTTLVDDRFDVSELLELAHHYGVSASNLVVEVTESEAVHDLSSLGRRSQQLRELGIGLAVDDAGAGHASFRVITRLRPTYIKLDRDLISNVDNDGARHAFVEAMVRFSRKIGSRLIAEGIETDAELASLAGLGVEAGQGFYLARPTVSEFILPTPDARRLIAAAAQRLQIGAAELAVGELARPAVVVSAHATVGDAHGLLCDDPGSQSVVVCNADGQAIAQVSRSDLSGLLAGHGGWTRVASRPLGELIGFGVQSVSAELDVLDAGAMLAARPVHEAIQDLVVTDARGRPVGIAPAREVIRALADARTRRSGELHPLSGLPDADWVEAELAARAQDSQPVSMLVIDLDRFRDLNEVGGYVLGDEVIRVFARCLAGAVAGVEAAAVAHVGGDDFLVLSPPRSHAELVADIVRRFEAEVIPLVRVELRLRGAPELAERVVLSMASLDLAGQPPPGLSWLDWARELLASPMQEAKTAVHHSLVRRVAEAVTVTTWTPQREARRQLSLGLVDPSVVVQALDRVELGWRAHPGTDRFPGPAALVERLLIEHAVPLRERAVQALEAGEDLIEVVLEGDEHDLMELLDRIVLVTRHAYARQPGTTSPELALLDRLLQQRARSMAREERVLPVPDRR